MSPVVALLVQILLSTHMAPPPKFQAARLQFLMDNIEGYAEADANGAGGDFLSELIERFSRRFPVRLDGVEVEPSAEELQKVDDTEELEEVQAPVKTPEMSDEEYAQAKAAFEKYERERNMLAGQIRNFMNYRNRNRLAPSTKAHRIVLDKLAGIGGVGRRKTAFNLWAESEEGQKVYRLELQKRLKDDTDKKTKGSSARQDEARVQQDEKESGAHEEGKKRMAFVTLRQEVIKTEFAKLPDEEKRKWHEAVEADFKSRKDAYDASVEVAYSKDPEARQRAIEDLPTWAVPFLEGIRGITGMNVSLFAGGPVPADGGDINVMGIHCGNTSESTPKTFGVVHRENLQKFFVPIFGDFCRKTFSKEDCEAAALGPDRKGGPIFGLNTEVMLDRWGDQEVADYWKAFDKAQAEKSKSQHPSNASSSSSKTSESKAQASDSKVPSPPIPANVNALSSSSKTSESKAQASDSKVPSPPIPANVNALSSSSKTSESKVPSQHIPANVNAISSSSKTAPAKPSSAKPPAAASSSVSSAPVGKGSLRPLPTGGQSASSARYAPSTINVQKLRTKTHVAMRTGGLPPKKKPVSDVQRQEVEGKAKDAKKREMKRKVVATKEVEVRGSAHDPIELGSSPVASSSRPVKREQPEVIDLSSDDAADSSPVPSPTRKRLRRRSPSRSSSPSTAFASPHPPQRPDHVAPSSPPASSQPPPDSPTPAERAVRRMKKRAISPSSTGSAEEISEALSRNVGSSPVKSTPAKKTSKRKEVFVEISAPPPPKRARKSTGGKSSDSSPSTSVNVTDQSWVKVAGGAPEYVAKMVQQGSRVVLEKDFERWRLLGRAWMDLEVELDFKGGRLTAVDRPACVGDWIQRARPVDWEPKPAVAVDGHRRELWDWWKACQPDWRRIEGSQALVRGSGEWEDLCIAGTNGIVSIMAGITFGLRALERLPREGFRERKFWQSEYKEWMRVLEDITWAFRETKKSLKV
ncbi:SERTA domain-containing protein 3 [Marasmius crinis-equi]|uniref:SERTA domain-containing protein 3 n=1 Tax=Marasmius crinis-equi TaxID=585013 RepID=A0ABR3FSJ1_9AGAR